MSSWERVLWKRQAFPDNYIPKHAFLASLRKNPNFKPWSYWPLVLLAGPITQHLATIFIFLAIFVRLKDLSLDPRFLVWLSVGCFVVGLGLWEALHWSSIGYLQTERLKTIKSSILTFLALMSLSPVLRTLTAATSSDSIWAISASLFTLNALLADYRTSVGMKDRLPSVISMNAGISASVVLASRLTSDLAVFALMLFSIQLFALFPTLRQRMQFFPAPIQHLVTLCLAALTLTLNAGISVTVTYLYLGIFGFSSFLAPGILIWAQQYKNFIRGPWDVAVPKVN